MIISVSRRCDIPRFSFRWFLERLDAGFVDVVNPFNSSQVRRVSLLPPSSGPSRRDRFGVPLEDQDAGDCAELFAFWTRDPGAILNYADELGRRGYAFYVMVTLTAYPNILEPNVPPPLEVINAMGLLSQKISPLRVAWRYDPVFLSSITDFRFHRQNFRFLAARLGGIVKKVIVSVYDEYAGAEKRLSMLEQGGLMECMPHYGNCGPDGRKPLLPELKELLAELAAIAGEEGIEIQSCAEDFSPDGGSAGLGIKSGSCIDGEYIESLFGIKNPGRDRNQRRPHCLCAKSVDIGAYSPCPAGCVYCYARPAVK